MKKTIFIFLIASCLHITTSQQLSDKELLRQANQLIRTAQSQQKNPTIQNLITAYRQAERQECIASSAASSAANDEHLATMAKMTHESQRHHAGCDHPYMGPEPSTYAYERDLAEMDMKKAINNQIKALRELQRLCQ